MNYTTLLTAGISVAFTLFSCKDSHRQDAVFGDKSPLFQLLPADATGIRFRNDLEYDREFNIYRYRNFYNGGGVAIGDVNNDGLPDIYFNGNMKTNRLYLNMGNWKFRDIAAIAGVTGSGSWSTGVSMADINGDGWLDIYVCNSGNPRSEEKENNHFSRANECFINRGKEGLKPDGTPTFEERATALGLADGGLTTHAAFFDYDQDGDLDAYVLNNSFRPIGSFDLRKNLRFTRDSLGGHKLYRNDGNTFTDVSKKAGILGSVIAFGLGVTVGDLDLDGWQDIYVSNDFFERDYLYHNNGDGTFTEQLEKSMRHISAASMGADMADVNNDAFPDIFVTDMLPEPDYRIKTTTSFDGPDRFKFTSSVGYYNQFTRNTFQLNNGDGTFSEIACLGNMEATDWSWGALLFDMDNDGDQDVYIVTGGAVEGDIGNNILYENPGNRNHWITLFLEGKTCNRDALGARIKVTVRQPNGNTRDIYTTVNTGGSFGSSSLRQEIGLGDATGILAIEVQWPKPGLPNAVFTKVPMNAAYKIMEGQPAVEPVPMKKASFKSVF